MRTRAGGGREGNRAPRPYPAPGPGLRAVIFHVDRRLFKSAGTVEMLLNDLSIASSLLTVTKQDRALLVLQQHDNDKNQHHNNDRSKLS